MRSLNKLKQMEFKGAKMVFEEQEANEYFELQSTLTVSADTLKRINVPGDGHCVLWAVTMAFLLPVRNNDSLFNERFVQLFGMQNKNDIEYIQKLLNNNNAFETAYNDLLLIELVTKVLCNRPVDEMLNLEIEHLHNAKISNLSYMINEKLITDEAYNEPFLLQNQTENLDQFQSDSAIKNSFDCPMRSCKFCALGELDIRVIEKLLKCHILVCSTNENAKFNISKNSANILLFNTNHTHYEFGLIKAELVMETLKRQNYQLAIDYIDLAVDKIDFRDENGEALLHMASLSGSESLVRVLINNGADLEALNAHEKTALHVAISLGHHDVAKTLLENGANADSLAVGEAALHVAVARNDSKSVKFLIDNEADVNIKDKYGRNALHLATQTGNIAIIDMLITGKCNLNETVASVGQTPLHFAVLFNHDEVVEHLIKNGALMDVRNRKGWTPLHVAVLNGCRKSVEILIENGVDVDCKTEKSQKTALHLAASKDNFHMIKILVEAGVNINSRSKTQETALHSAVLGTVSSNIVEYLLLNGADINAKFEGGFTALHLAVLKGHLKTVKEVLNCCQNVNAENDNGDSPLQTAVRIGQADVAEMLIRNGGNVLARNQFHSVLHQAVRNVDILKLVLAEIKNKLEGDAAQLRSVMNAEDENGNTPLMWAAQGGNLTATKWLLEFRETDINRQNCNGRTALHWAAHSGHLEVVILLIYWKADAEIRDNNFETAFDLARHKIIRGENYAAIADLVVNVNEEVSKNCFGHFLLTLNALFKSKSKCINM